jgi:Integrase core domain
MGWWRRWPRCAECRWVGGNLPEEARRAQVRVLRPGPVQPGSEAQIDDGRLGVWTDPATGRRHTVRAFVMVLACSRYMFVRPVLRMDQEAWTRCHVEAFAFFNGVPARLVPDNLKTGVDKPDLYDPQINRSYAELAAHDGTLVDPARAFKPKDKPRVERPMPTCGTLSGGGGRSPPCRTCSPVRFAGRGRWPEPGPAARWTEPHRLRCSPPWRPRRWGRCRRPRSCWLPGRAAVPEKRPVCFRVAAVEDHVRSANHVLTLVRHRPPDGWRDHSKFPGTSQRLPASARYRPNCGVGHDRPPIGAGEDAVSQEAQAMMRHGQGVVARRGGPTRSLGWPILSAASCDRRSTLAGAQTVWFGGSGISACLDGFVSGREGRKGHLSKGVAQRLGRR